ncbi:hypothetical protein [Corynebacterium frankenforstense]|uniref:hypothetical protein n=1 Tax=Corynebacterium frankenforstense TaxID=1230998 RepID=UPI0026EA99ED|nr:hypothetical protein [Corynebacterium frankenforstense]
MKLFTRKGIVTLGATVAIATTGIAAPAHAEDTTPAPTTTEAPADPNLGTNSSEFDCTAEKDPKDLPVNVKNSLKCQWEIGGFEKQLGIITGFATLITTVIGVASAVFNMAKKVAPDMF